jgi:hypothetical protein
MSSTLPAETTDRVDGAEETAVSKSSALPSVAPVKHWRRRHRVVRARLAAVSVRAAMNAGALVGLAVGLVVGAVSGALLVWFAGAVLDWQRQLSFTLGVTQTLLPFGDQTSNLRALSRNWFLVIPAASLIGGVVTAAFGGLIGGLIAAGYNRTTRRARVLVEISRKDNEQAAVDALEVVRDPSVTGDGHAHRG